MTELDYLHGELESLKAKVKNEENKAVWKKAAEELRGYYDSLISAGFTEAQAWWFVTAAVRQAWGIS